MRGPMRSREGTSMTQLGDSTRTGGILSVYSKQNKVIDFLTKC